MLTNRLVFCIAKIQVIIVTSSSIFNIPFTLTFCVHVLPFKWLNKEFKVMLQNLFAFLNMVLPLFIASITSSSASSVHFIFPLIVGILQAFGGLHMGFDLGGMFSWLMPFHFNSCEKHAKSWIPFPF